MRQIQEELNVIGGGISGDSQIDGKMESMDSETEVICPEISIYIRSSGNRRDRL